MQSMIHKGNGVFAVPWGGFNPGNVDEWVDLVVSAEKLEMSPQDFIVRNGSESNMNAIISANARNTVVHAPMVHLLESVTFAIGRGNQVFVPKAWKDHILASR